MKQYIFSALLLFTQLVNAQSLVSGIEKAYSKFENDPQLTYGLGSLTVLNAETGKVVFSKNGTIGLAPASTLKTVTSITAFNLLGSDFKWETTLGYTGTIANGILSGDIIITGSGDPTLGSERYSQSKREVLLNAWKTAIKNAGIKKINGRIIGDDNLFGTQIIPLGWIWQDIGNYYGAGASSLSWKENQFGVKFKAGKQQGELTTVTESTISLPQLKLINEVITGSPGSGDNVYAYSAPFTDIIYLRGTYGIDLKKTIMVSTPDPALSLSYDLKEILNNDGISVNGVTTTTRRLDLAKENYSKPAHILNAYSSPSLIQTVYWLNQKSINLYAENMLKTIALKQGKASITENGVAEVQKFWYGKMKISPNAMAILDGSGLSPENRITTMAMASILQSTTKEPWYKYFYESLPLNNGMRMKSGSIRNVLAYAGYHKSASGTPLVFAFITNNYSGSTSAIKQKMFNVLDELK